MVVQLLTFASDYRDDPTLFDRASVPNEVVKPLVRGVEPAGIKNTSLLKNPFDTSGAAESSRLANSATTKKIVGGPAATETAITNSPKLPVSQRRVAPESGSGNNDVSQVERRGKVSLPLLGAGKTPQSQEILEYITNFQGAEHLPVNGHFKVSEMFSAEEDRQWSTTLSGDSVLISWNTRKIYVSRHSDTSISTDFVLNVKGFLLGTNPQPNIGPPLFVTDSNSQYLMQYSRTKAITALDRVPTETKQSATDGRDHIRYFQRLRNDIHNTLKSQYGIHGYLRADTKIIPLLLIEYCANTRNMRALITETDDEGWLVGRIVFDEKLKIPAGTAKQAHPAGETRDFKPTALHNRAITELGSVNDDISQVERRGNTALPLTGLTRADMLTYIETIHADLVKTKIPVAQNDGQQLYSEVFPTSVDGQWSLEVAGDMLVVAVLPDGIYASRHLEGPVFKNDNAKAFETEVKGFLFGENQSNKGPALFEKTDTGAYRWKGARINIIPVARRPVVKGFGPKAEYMKQIEPLKKSLETVLNAEVHTRPYRRADETKTPLVLPTWTLEWCAHTRQLRSMISEDVEGTIGGRLLFV